MLVDVKELGGGQEFLEKALSVKRLNFQTYIQDFVPRAVQENSLSDEKLQALITLMAKRLGEMQDINKLQESRRCR